MKKYDIAQYYASLQAKHVCVLFTQKKRACMCFQFQHKLHYEDKQNDGWRLHDNI